MKKKLAQRYGIWSLAGQDHTAPQAQVSTASRPKSISNSPSHIGKLDDFQTSMLLYSYGVPISIAINGVSKFANGQTAHCTTKKISSQSVDLIYKSSTSAAYKPPHDKPDVGSSISLDLEEICAFEGIITSQSKEGFQVAVDGGYQSMLSSKLAEKANRIGIKHDVSFAAGPGITRIELTDKNCGFRDHTGILRRGKIVNLSRVDALITATTIPPKPTIISFEGSRKYAAEVTSTCVIGFMVKFCIPIPASEFSKDMHF